jgi:hypothetical protein
MTDKQARTIISRAFWDLEVPSVSAKRTKTPMTDEQARSILAKGIWCLERPSDPSRHSRGPKRLAVGKR